jgi:ribosomal protein S17
MIKIKFLAILVFFFIGSNTLLSQTTPGVLMFKDGNSKQGFLKFSGAENVKLKPKKYEKAIKYHFSELDYAKFYYGDKVAIYKFVPVSGKKSHLVLEEIVEGKVSLYTLVSKGYSIGMGPMNAGGAPIFNGGNYYEINNLYVLKEGEKEAVHLGSNLLFSKNFKKAASSYFNDCPKLVKKIENKEFHKENIQAVVEFYNRECIE